MNITTHTLVRNEENWIWFSLMAWKNYSSEMLVVDDNSDDKTAQIIKSIKDAKIKYSKLDLKTANDHTDMRNKMISETKTDWFLILDGDEIWNYETIQKFLSFLEQQPKSIYGVGMRTRNCVGDIYHYQPESAGKYRILGRHGHLTIRAFRKLPHFKWLGDYPLEAYCDENGSPVNGQEEHLNFYDGYYWHTTHLPRSSVKSSRKHLQSVKSEWGIPVASESEFPEVFSLPRPEIVPSPFKKRSIFSSVQAAIITPGRILKRKLLK